MITLNSRFCSTLDQWYREKKAFLFAIDFPGEKTLLFPLEEVPEEKVVFDVEGITNRSIRPLAISWHIEESVSWETYLHAFQKVQAYQRSGENYLLNLTFPSKVWLSHDLWEIAYSVQSPYVLGVKGEFVVFSPESFITIEDNRISTFPMKGTLPATAETNVQSLLDDPKEQAEHIAIVDLLRNDLGMVCTEVSVRHYRYVQKINRGRGELYQTSSHIEGKLKPHINLSDIFQAMLPAGSISGVPKHRAIEIIREVEGYNRGWYTGVFGIFDGKKLSSAVMIRFLEQNENGIFYKSGGGIMIYSNPHKEYNELLEKIYVPVF